MILRQRKYLKMHGLRCYPTLPNAYINTSAFPSNLNRLTHDVCLVSTIPPSPADTATPRHQPASYAYSSRTAVPRRDRCDRVFDQRQYSARPGGGGEVSSSSSSSSSSFKCQSSDLFTSASLPRYVTGVTTPGRRLALEEPTTDERLHTHTSNPIEEKSRG